MTEEDPEDGLRVLARLSSSTQSSTQSSSKQSSSFSSSKTFFVWGTGNEILVRNERVLLGHKNGNDDLEDEDEMMHKDEESVKRFRRQKRFRRHQNEVHVLVALILEKQARDRAV